MKPLIICGSAECLFDDLFRIERFVNLKDKLVGPAVACINHTALYYPYHFDYWISHHSELFTQLKPWVKGRPYTLSDMPNPEVDQLRRFGNFLCTDSGLLAVKMGLQIGYSKIILCGVPLDNTRKFYEPYGAENQHAATNIQEGWKKETAGFEKNIRSMSGNTKAMFGEPDARWINED